MPATSFVPNVVLALQRLGAHNRVVHPVPNPMDTVPLRFKKKAVPPAPVVGDGNGKDVTVAVGQGRGRGC